MSDNLILDASNNPLIVTNLGPNDASTAVLGGVPLGTTSASATGELAVKVHVVSASTTAGDATAANQTTQITAEQAILAKLPTVGTATAPGSNVLTVQNPAVTQVISTAFETSHVLKASAGQLKQLTIFNSKASAQFILLINATSLPSNGAVTLLYPPIPIAAASILVLDLPSPLVASTGIVVANSSTGTFSLTIGSADCAFYAQVN